MDAVEKKITELIEENRPFILDFAEDIYNHAQPAERADRCGAAGDHMGLMAHALGLTSVWLSDTPENGRRFKKAYGLPEEFEVAMHLAIGYAAAGSIKSGRVPLDYMIHHKKE